MNSIVFEGRFIGHIYMYTHLHAIIFTQINQIRNAANISCEYQVNYDIYLSYKSWNLEIGTWNSELGTWNSELGTRNLA